MSTGSVLLSELRQLGATVDVIGDRLRIEVPRGTMTNEMRQAVRAHKAEVIAAVKRKRAQGPDGWHGDDCVAAIGEVFAELKRTYIAGTFDFIAGDNVLAARLGAVEDALQRITETGSESAFRQALHRSTVRSARPRDLLDKVAPNGTPVAPGAKDAVSDDSAEMAQASGTSGDK